MSVFQHSIIPQVAPIIEPDVNSCRFVTFAALQKIVPSLGDRKKWTLSLWCKKQHHAYSTAEMLFSAYDSTAAFTYFYFSDDGELVFRNYVSSSDDCLLTTTKKFADTSNWYHVHLIYDSANSTEADRLRIYVNGERETSFSGTPNYPGASVDTTVNAIDAHYVGMSAGGYYYNGYLSDVYFIDGAAVLPSGFTQTKSGMLVPKEYVMTSTGSNSFHLDFSNNGHTANVFHQSDHLDGAVDFTDSSSFGRPISHTATGYASHPPVHKTTVSNPFVNTDYSVHFGGAGYIGTDVSTSDFDMGTGDFTCELWMKPTNVTAGYRAVVGTTKYGLAAGYLGAWQLYQNGDDLELWTKAPGSVQMIFTTTTNVLTAGEWVHVCFLRDGTSMKLYIDGTLTQTNGSSRASSDFDDTGLWLGVNQEGAYYYVGDMYDVRFVNGTAIVPPSGGPTSKLTAVTNTKFLLQPERADGSVQFLDKSGVTRTLWDAGSGLATSPAYLSPHLSSADNGSAIKFDGVSDNINYARNYGTSLDMAPDTADWTIDFWVYYDSTSGGYHTVYDLGYASSLALLLQCSHSDRKLYIYSSGYLCTESTGADLQRWHYYSVRRDGTTLTIHRDGVQTASATIASSTSFNPTSAYKAAWGTSNVNHSNTYGLYGYLYDMRVRNGVVGSTAVPTAPAHSTSIVHPGADSSLHKNHFGTLNLSATHNHHPESPNTGKNYAVLNSQDAANGTVSHGGLKYATTASNTPDGCPTSTIGMGGGDGKFLGEFFHLGSSSDWYVGVNNGEAEDYIGGTHGIGYLHDGTIYKEGSSSQSSLATVTTGDVIGVAVDLSGVTRSVQFFKNGATLGSAETIPSTWTHVHFACGSDVTGVTWLVNFGQDPTFYGEHTTTEAEFAYPVGGYKALCSGNMPTPGISDPTQYFDTTTYDTSGSKSFGHGGMKPDLCIFKDRTNGGRSYKVVDSVRGVQLALETDSTDYEATESTGLISFDTDGFTVGNDAAYATSGGTVAWGWKAGTTTYSDTSFSTTADFSIMKWTGDGQEDDMDDGYGDQDQDILHRLTGKPEFIMAADRTQNGSSNDSVVGGFYVWHKDLPGMISADTDGDGGILTLSSGSAEIACEGGGSFGYGGPFYTVGSTTIEFNNGESDDSDLYLLNYGGNYDTSMEGFDNDPDDYVAYAWRSVPSFSKFGKYIGFTGVEQFIYLGFEPAAVLIKAVTSTENWLLFDNTRGANSGGYTNLYNTRKNLLYPSSAGAESGSSDIGLNFCSNGFKAIGTDTTHNFNGVTYIYAAWASSNFKTNRGVI